MYLRTSEGWDRRGHKRPTCEGLGNRPQLTKVTCYVAGLVLGFSFPLCKMGIKKCPLGCVTVRIKSTERRDSNAYCENSILSLLVGQPCYTDTIQCLAQPLTWQPLHTTDLPRISPDPLPNSGWRPGLELCRTEAWWEEGKSSQILYFRQFVQTEVLLTTR